MQVQMQTRAPARKSYPSDVSDEDWAFVAPYLALLREDAGQRAYRLREVFNALRWMVRAGAPWRLLPSHFPPWAAVHQQPRRWLAAGVFEAIAHDVRILLRMAEERAPEPHGGDLRQHDPPGLRLRHAQPRRQAAPRKLMTRPWRRYLLSAIIGVHRVSPGLLAG